MTDRINRVKNQLRARQQILGDLENEAAEIHEKYHHKSNTSAFYTDNSFSKFSKESSPSKDSYTKLDDSLIYNPSVASKASERANTLMTFLNETEFNTHEKPHDTISKSEYIQLKLELEDSQKTVISLKELISKQKEKLLEKDQEHSEDLQFQLEKQKREFEDMIEKNVSFIEQLLTEKETRVRQLNELNLRIKEMEGQHYIALQEVKEKYHKEIKKGKDQVITTEKIKRDSWMKEKAKEIKEQTAKGLEPEIMRLINEHKRTIDRLKEDQQTEMRQYKHEIDQTYEKRLLDFKEDHKQKMNEALERERESYKIRISEMHLKQEEEFQKMRKN